MSNVYKFSSASSAPLTLPAQVKYSKTSKVQNTPNVIIINGAIVTGDWEINPYGTTSNMESIISKKDSIIEVLEQELAEVRSQRGLFTRNVEDDEVELFAELDRQFYSLSPRARKISVGIDSTKSTVVDVIDLENDEE